MGSRTNLSKLMGSQEPMEPMLTEPLTLFDHCDKNDKYKGQNTGKGRYWTFWIRYGNYCHDQKVKIGNTTKLLIQIPANIDRVSLS